MGKKILTRKLLAVVLTAATAFTSVAPGVYAAEASGEDTAPVTVEGQIEEKKSAPEEKKELPAEPAAEEKAAPAEKNEEPAAEEKAAPAEEKNAEEKQAPEFETKAETQKQEQVPAEKKAEESKPAAKGKVFVSFEGAGTVKVIIASDKGAAKDDPSVTIKKEEGKKASASFRNDLAKAAAVSSDRFDLVLELEEGDKVTIIPEAAEGYEASSYKMQIDSGAEKAVDLNGNGEYVITVSGSDQIFGFVSAKAEQEAADPEKKNDAEQPAAEEGVAEDTEAAEGEQEEGLEEGLEDELVEEEAGEEEAVSEAASDAVPSVSINGTTNTNEQYNFSKFGMGDYWTSPLKIKDSNGVSTSAFCGATLMGGSKSEKSFTRVEVATDPEIIKCAYYSILNQTMAKKVLKDTGKCTGDQTKAAQVLGHFCMSLIIQELYPSRVSPKVDLDKWAKDGYKINGSRHRISSWVPGAVRKFRSNLASLPVPDGYTVYLCQTSKNYQQIYYYITETPTGDLKVKKVSSDPQLVEGNSCYSLAGARYGVYKTMDGANSFDEDQLIEVLETNASGNSQTISLDEGTYYVREIEASEGYFIDSKVYTASVTKGNTTTVTSTEVPGDDPKVVMIDKMNKLSDSEKMLSLEGTQFEVKYYDGYYDAETLPASATRTWVFATHKTAAGKYIAAFSEDWKISGDALYKTEGGNTVFPLGTITVTEKQAAPGYVNDGTFGDAKMYIGQIVMNEDHDDVDFISIQGTPKTTNTTEIHFEVSDTPAFGGLKISKLDYETKTAEAQGDATLEGAEFEIYNDNEYSVVFGGNEIAPGALVTKITTGKDGIAKTAEKALQTGTYRIVEKKAPAGYTVDGITSRPVTISKDGEYVDMTAADLAIQNRVIRGDLKFKKVDKKSGAPLAGISFKITHVKTGESHIVTTDENGVFDSSAVKHSKNTNGGGAGDGVWFGKASVNDSYGAFPYGAYTMEEIPGANNERYKMVSVNFTINTDSVALSLGDIENYRKPEITTILSTEDGAKEVGDNGKVKLVDKVMFENMDDFIGEDLTFHGDLIVKSTGEKVASAETTKKIESGDGSANVSFEVDVKELGGESLVAYQYVYDKDGGLIIDHCNINDADETVDIITIYTTATDSETNDHISNPDEEVTVNDEVFYENLIIGKEYTISGVLMDKETGNPLLAGGKEVRASKTFTADKKNGSIILSFTFNGSALAGKSVVAFETISRDGKDIAVHADLRDEDQTVYFPEVETSVEDAKTKIRNTMAGPNAKIIDTVSYSNLIAGKEYTVTGTLMNKETKAPVTVGGKEVTGETTFTPDTANGTVKVEFIFDASGLEDKDLVAFEELYLNGKLVGEHKDINDDNQTVHVPEGETEAESVSTGSRIGKPAAEQIIKDVLVYKNLIPGKEYEVRGKVMLKSTGNEISSRMIDKDGNDLEKFSFTPDAADGSVELYFVIDASQLAGGTVVLFERVYHNGSEVIVHEDINDEDQSVLYPSAYTSAYDSETNEHVSRADANVTIYDKYFYENLLEGEEYTVKGTMMDKATGEPVVIDGKKVEGKTTFTAEAGSGSVIVEFDLDATSLKGRTIVAFEDLYYGNELIFHHANLDDAEQTIYFPGIGTTAKDAKTGIANTLAEENAKILDTVTYSNLDTSVEYTVKGVLMRKDTGEPLMIDGKEVTSEKKFTPAQADGEVTIEFSLDASELKGISLVAFEELYVGSELLAEHKDINDENQTDHIPDGETNANDSETGIEVALASEDNVIVDTFTYRNLIPGKTYSVKGRVMDQETGEEVPSRMINESGEDIAEREFVPETADGSIDLYFAVDASELAGKNVVVFENAFYEGKKIIVHEDLEDENQTIHYPDGETEAVDEKTGIKNTLAEENAIIRDVFRYENLVVGHEYHITGKVMDKATGEEIDSFMADENGTPVENGYFILNPETEDGTVDLYFVINASELANHDLVMLERVSVNGKTIIIHEDIDDENQTVYVPEGETTARDSETQTQLSLADDSVTIIDTFIFRNLIPGQEYSVSGRVMRKADGKEIHSVITDGTANDGSAEITNVSAGNVTFIAKAADGSLDISFNFDGSELAGEDVVVFERCYHDGNEVIIHENIDDESQTVHVPDGETEAQDVVTEDHISRIAEETVIADTFMYSNLIPGKTYSVKGRVMDKESGEEVNATMINSAGEPIDSFEFTAEEADGAVVLYFRLDTSDIAGHSIVLFERMQYNGKDIVIHEDLEDEDQTIHIPDGYTTATDNETGSHTSWAKADVTINDIFHYRNLKPGIEYTVNGVLMDKETGEPMLANGQEIRSSVTFTPESADGEVLITFTFNGVELQGKTTVAFETLLIGDIELVVHEDLEDEAQTVRFPSVETTATDKKDGDHKLAANGKVTVVDHVVYTNLDVNKNYRVVGTLMAKNGTAVKVKGKELTASAEFTPEAPDGEIDLEISFDVSSLESGDYVMFEKLYEINEETGDEVIVGVHEDLKDEAQTVTVPTRPNNPPKTGDSPIEGIWMLMMAMAAGFVLVVMRRRTAR